MKTRYGSSSSSSGMMIGGLCVIFLNFILLAGAESSETTSETAQNETMEDIWMRNNETMGSVMGDKFSGKYELTKSENFEEYMKAVGMRYSLFIIND